VGGLVGSTLVKSPAQAAADARPPTPSVVTAEVEHRVLSNTVVLRGTFAPGHVIAATPTAVPATADGPAGSTLIVTKIKAAAGQAVAPGQVLLEFSGRPLYALSGSVPAYRDLVPGESGADVAQLQAALAAVGYPATGDVSGRFGEATKAAVTSFYLHLGYPVPVTGDATRQAVRTAQAAVDQQQQSVTDLRGQLSGAQSGKSAAAGSDAANGATVTDGTTVAEQLRHAEQVLRIDNQALADARSKDGPMVPSSEVVFLPTFPARVQSLPASVGDAVAKPLITLATGGLTLVGQLQPSQAELVKAGMKVQVLSEVTGVEAAGTVKSIGSVTSGTSAAEGQPAAGGATTGVKAASPADGSAFVPVAVSPDGIWDQRLDGQDVRLTITSASTLTPVLAVPEAALSSNADARTTVTVVDGTGTQRRVEVKPGVSADGLVEVTSPQGGLTPGMRVKVGQ
jgi:hypothetical protein